ncbi:hypothetical protein, variant 1 [Aphanomyces astaci]|uniref:Chloride channel protein n=1 Tax=Aphanomyces astaci TaxID=112090 RepID=W4FZI5_APHAT|nr:hypothetical protein, variant 1 [Aphanomyces astaci]ETV72897.1 hypothetical protein, variant 1 [Aphanomyces astaci]|eukprot:XP_009837683.1 hypothetical protein, variant 1 [Aphanomyces astaci]
MAYRPLSQHGGSTSHDSIQYESVEFVTYDARFTKGDLSHLQGDIAPPTFAPCGCGPTTFSWRNKMISLTKWLLTLLIGVATAHVAVLINLATSSLVSWKFHTLQALLVQEAQGTSMHGMGVLFLVACNAWCVGIASLLTTFWAPASAGSGIPEIKSTLNGVHVKVWMSMDTLVCKIVGVILSVSGGLPVGKEGPMIHSASIIGAFFSSKRSYQGCGWRPVVFLQEKDVRDLVTCGAAAGVAAAFGAPIGGVLFALEEGASFLSPKLIWRAFFCAMVAACVVFGSSLASFSETASKSSLFAFGKMVDPTVDRASYLPWELVVFMAIGAVGGVLGAIFNQINKCIMYRTQLRQLPLPLKVVYVMGVSVGLSVVWYFLSAFIGTCQTMPPAISTTEKARLVNHLVPFTCPSGQYNDLASLFLAPQDAALKQLLHLQSTLASPPTFTTSSLVAFAFCYFLGTAMVFGSSITSGVFVPCILVGAALGRVAGRWMHSDELNFVNLSTYALVGAAAVMGGVTRMTISLAIILLEATGDLQYALPLMMALMPARWVGNLFSEGLYEVHIHCRRLPFLDWSPPKGAEHMSVTLVMKPEPVSCFGKRERVGTLLAELELHPQQMCWAVVERRYDLHTGQPEKVLEGTIQRNVLVRLLHQKATWNPFSCADHESDRTNVHVLESDHEDAVPLDMSKFSVADRECFVNLEFYVNPSPGLINGAFPLVV